MEYRKFSLAFFGCWKVNLENSLKYFVIFFALMDFYGRGHLIIPMNDDNAPKIQFHGGEKSDGFYESHPNDVFSSDFGFGNVNKTFFKTTNNSMIVSQVGSIVQLPCRAHLVGDEMVSWIRRKDYHLLTVGLTTYSSDERFNVIHYDETEDWQLQIKFVQLRDAGSYECAVSSHPSISLFIRLHVTESKARIDGPPERYLKPGSALRLTCKILDNIENPLFIFWYHNSKMVNYDSHLGINVSIQLENKFSELLILQTTLANSGNYSCLASNAAAASVLVHIINGENPFGLAMYGAASAKFSNQSNYFTLIFFMALISTYQFHPGNIINRLITQFRFSHHES